MKFFKQKPKNQPLPVTPQMKQKLAEQELSNKINSLADWLEGQKNWSMFDGYVVMGFIMRQSLGPQLGNKKELADKAIDALFIEETIEQPKDLPIKNKIINIKEE